MGEVKRVCSCKKGGCAVRYKTLVRDYEHTLVRCQNLNLYCDYLLKHFLDQSQRDAVMERFSGMPGYSEAEALGVE